MEPDGKIELRKLPPKMRSELCQILSSNDQWKIVMAHIPRSNEDQTNKYTTDHVSIIENHSLQTGKMAMDILLEEWGTSGRRRPTVNDLYNLCYSLELFRAADYLMEVFLGGSKSKPSHSVKENNSEPSHSVKENNSKPSPSIKQNNSKPSHSDRENNSTQEPKVNYVNIPNNHTAGANFKLGAYAQMDSEELHKQLDSLIIDSQEQVIPAEEPSILDLEDISLIQTHLPHFAYSFLQTITNNFSNVSFWEGGNMLGAGAFGSVYHGKLSGQLGLQNTAVAVKRLSRDTTKVDEQFSNEINMMGLVSHQNLLTLLAYSNDGEELCLLYPFMENGSLQERLGCKMKDKPSLAPMQRLKIAHGTSKGLLYLHNASHTKPLVHRDVKTANILLDKNLEPKLGDFGLVRLGGSVQEDSGLPMTVLTEVAVGTSAYMAPEAVRGEISVKMDVYSFGVVILELLTGLPVMDSKRETRDLVGHLEELIEDGEEIEDCLDKQFSMMEWRQVSPKQLHLVSKVCLEKKKNRPYMSEVCDLIYACFH